MITHSPDPSHQVQLELELAYPAAYHHTKLHPRNFNSALRGGYCGYKSKMLYENKIHLNVYLKMMF